MEAWTEDVAEELEVMTEGVAVTTAEGEEETTEIHSGETHHKVMVVSNAERRVTSLVNVQTLQQEQEWVATINVSSAERLDIFHENAQQEEVTNVSTATKRAIKREIVPLNPK